MGGSNNILQFLCISKRTETSLQKLADEGMNQWMHWHSAGPHRCKSLMNILLDSRFHQCRIYLHPLWMVVHTSHMYVYLHKKISKRNLADVGMNQWMHCMADKTHKQGMPHNDMLSITWPHYSTTIVCFIRPLPAAQCAVQAIHAQKKHASQVTTPCRTAG